MKAKTLDKPLSPSAQAALKFQKANYYNNHGRYKDAIRHYHKVIQLSPNHYKAMTNLGNAFYDEGRHAESRRAYQEAIRVKPTYAKAWCNLGHLFLSLSKWEEARQASAQAARLEPDDETAWNNLGYALNELGKPLEAIKALKKALKIYPGDPAIRYNLGVSYLLSDNVDAARREVEHLEWQDDEKAMMLAEGVSDWLDAHPEYFKKKPVRRGRKR